MTDRNEMPETELQLRSSKDAIGMTIESLAEDPAFVDHSTEAQAARLLSELRRRPVSTINAARHLDIVHPPSTVRYLRRRGFLIRTRWVYMATGLGRKPHRVGEYILIEEAA